MNKREKRRLFEENAKKVKLKPRKSDSTTNSKLVEGGEKDVKRTKKNNK
tara:strand:- start:366 stop:512 length:147 start_codon:yes stop_codon:yes gene_type:complete